MLVSFFAMNISDFSYFIVIKLLKISDLSKFLKGYLMLKILNNDKFTTAQNRHFLVSLKIPILNTLHIAAKKNAALLAVFSLYQVQKYVLNYSRPRISGKNHSIFLTTIS